MVKESSRSNLFNIDFVDQVDQIILDRPHFLHQYHLNVIKFSSNRLIDDEKERDIIDSTDEDLQEEVERLKKAIREMNEDFYLQRKDFEDHCCEQLRKLNEKAEKTHRLQQDLEKGFLLRFVFIFFF